MATEVHRQGALLAALLLAIASIGVFGAGAATASGGTVIKDDHWDIVAEVECEFDEIEDEFVVDGIELHIHEHDDEDNEYDYDAGDEFLFGEPDTDLDLGFEVAYDPETCEEGTPAVEFGLINASANATGTVSISYTAPPWSVGTPFSFAANQGGVTVAGPQALGGGLPDHVDPTWAFTGTPIQFTLQFGTRPVGSGSWSDTTLVRVGQN